jgi:hypothetical protein
VPYQGPEAGSPREYSEIIYDFQGPGVNLIGSCLFLQSKKKNKTVRNFGDAKNAFLNYFFTHFF